MDRNWQYGTRGDEMDWESMKRKGEGREGRELNGIDGRTEERDKERE